MIYDIEALRRAWLAGDKFKFLFFWRPTPAANGRIMESCLSQWWMCGFTVDSVYYSCAEQYMMAEKARLFGDEETLSSIMAAKHPKQMKDYGRAVRNFDRDVWDSRCFEIVCRANMAKFGQNPALLAYLLGTKSRILAEASPMDRIWGIGMGRDHPDAGDPMKWRGRNLLGFALIRVRDQLCAKA